MTLLRTEFGYERTKCGCNICKTNCRWMPGFLIPSDLDRMIPGDANPFLWAESNVLASPGALVMRGTTIFHIPTLVPAVKPDRSCIHLTAEGLCKIHETAPFGCAFFDCGSDPRNELSKRGLMTINDDIRQGGLYFRLWLHLDALGKTQLPPEEFREYITGRKCP